MHAVIETFSADSVTVQRQGATLILTRADCELWLQGMNIARRLFPESGQEKQSELVKRNDTC